MSDWRIVIFLSSTINRTVHVTWTASSTFTRCGTLACVCWAYKYHLAITYCSYHSTSRLIDLSVIKLHRYCTGPYWNVSISTYEDSYCRRNSFVSKILILSHAYASLQWRHSNFPTSFKKLHTCQDDIGPTRTNLIQYSRVSSMNLPKDNDKSQACRKYRSYCRVTQLMGWRYEGFSAVVLWKTGAANWSIITIHSAEGGRRGKR
jgi:hypothetical protein